jgi:uncharacterized protein (TIGR02145 family)
MKQISSVVIAGAFLLFALMHSSCNKEGQPSLKTLPVSEISSTIATSGGDITDDGGNDITAKGVVWSREKNPTIESHLGITMDGIGKDDFISALTGLYPETQYYVRAYATNSAGTAYGNTVDFRTFILLAGSPCPGIPTVTDYNGNVYNTVQIGNQCWMKENLKARNYNSGATIPNIQSISNWLNLSTDARCWYNNDSATYAATYGSLYNWYAVNHSGGLCPTGWHVPTDAEWTLLTNLLGGLSVAGGPLKKTAWTHWANPNLGATDSTGFTALPGGYRSNIDGLYSNWRCNGNFWSSTATTVTGALSRTLHYSDSAVTPYNVNKNIGFSVRCIKD